jgi:hypothetical protein
VWLVRLHGVGAALYLTLISLLFIFPSDISAQTNPANKLPSAEKIVENYLKVIGGKKKVSLVRDSTSEWVIKLNDQPIGRAKTLLKAPSSRRTEFTFGNGQILSGTTSASAWVQGLDNRLLTLTGAEAANAKLIALLEASHLLDLKKANILARVVSLGDLASDAAYIVEFSQRGGARLRYWFSVKSGLLVKVEDELRKTTLRFADYQVQAPLGVREPQQVAMTTGDGELEFRLEHVSYNTNLPNSTFEPPAADQTLNVVELLRAVSQNQEAVERRVTEYAFLQKETDRELNDKGELKREKTRVYEVFPVANREPIMKLISENGVPLSEERAAKESKKVIEEFEKTERERSKLAEKAAQRKAKRNKKRAAKADDDENDDPEISQFLKACEFVSPRREIFAGREAVVFDFRPRPGFKPANRSETLISKLVGVAWIDPVDKQVIRLEARLAESFKMGGGLLLSLKPGAGLVMEQTRMAEGVWLPRLAQVNLSAKLFLFRGIDINKTIEWSDYRHFAGDVNDYKLDLPKAEMSNHKP